MQVSKTPLTRAKIFASEAEELRLTILLPCLNEVKTLATCIGKANSFIASAGISAEVIVADNGSTDGSIELAKKLGARVVPVAERGYGSALRGGIAAARGKYVVMGDADDSYDFGDLSIFLSALDEGAQLVMGNRFQGGIAHGAMPPLHRYLGNPVLSWIGRRLFRVPVGDFHCGLRAFRRDAILELGLESPGMEFASEMVVRASLAGLAIAEVPTRLHKDGRDRPPHLNTWRDGWRHLRFLLLHSPRWTFLYPGAALLVAGAALVAALWPGRLTLSATVSLDFRAFLFGCLALLVGIQALTFGLITRSFAARNGLLPDRAETQRWLAHLTVERLLQAAAILGILGIGGLALTVGAWGRHGFGEFPGEQMLRGLSLSATAVAAAMQLGFSSFLLGVIELRPREDARARLVRLTAHFQNYHDEG